MESPSSTAAGSGRPRWERFFAFLQPWIMTVNINPTLFSKYKWSFSLPAPQAHHLPFTPALPQQLLRRRGDPPQLSWG